MYMYYIVFSNDPTNSDSVVMSMHYYTYSLMYELCIPAFPCCIRKIKKYGPGDEAGAKKKKNNNKKQTKKKKNGMV